MLSRRSDLSARPKIFASLPNFFFVFFGVDDRTPKIPLYYFRQAAQKTSLFLFSAEDFDFGYFPKKTRRKSKRRKIFGWPKKIGECAEFLKEYHPRFSCVKSTSDLQEICLISVKRFILRQRQQ